MWTELSAESISVHALQYGGDAALVSTHELDDAADGGGLQRHGGVFAAAAPGVGGGVGGSGSAVRRCVVTGLFARARESTERSQLGLVAPGADDDDVRLGGYCVEAVPTPEYS